ncbi:MAG: hypothetical protein H0X50_01490 [Nitrosopumilus sp.]|nr:hypothetical protein [Nitrosopumilus sp.]
MVGLITTISPANLTRDICHATIQFIRFKLSCKEINKQHLYTDSHNIFPRCGMRTHSDIPSFLCKHDSWAMTRAANGFATEVISKQL